MLKRKFPGPSGYAKKQKTTGSGYTKKSANAIIAAIKRKKFGMYRGLKPEIKTVDTGFLFTIPAVGVGPQFILLNGTQQGTGTFNRIGTKINMRSFQLRASFESVASQANQDVCRIMLVWDKNANKVVPTFADIVQSKDQAGAVSSGIDDMRNIDNTERFKIVYDQEFFMSAQSATPYISNYNTGDSQMQIDWYKKLNLPTQYTGTANPATVAQITSGSLYLVVFSGVTSGYQLSGTARIRFDDH